MEPGSTVADIGTDHAYLPIYLMKNKIAPRVIATEINTGPLNIAKKNISKAGFEEEIEIRLGNGLEPIKPGEIEVAVIAGMGGITINTILQNSFKVAHSLKKIILQPMTDVHLVRAYLQNHNFKLKNEELEIEDGHYYEILVVTPGEAIEYDDLLLEIGPILLKKKHPLMADFLEEKIFNYRKVINSLDNCSGVGAQEKKQYLGQKVSYLEKVITCL